jgi:hypothetical protein
MTPKKTKAKKTKPGKSRTAGRKAPKANAATKKAKKAKKKKALKAKRRGPVRKGSPSEGELVSFETRGRGARSAGQSGDTQGLPAAPDVDSESVEELLEEGQSFEAEVVEGVENVPDADEGEVRTREVEEDDVPEEYQKPDRD